MKYVMKIVGLAGTQVGPGQSDPSGRYLFEYDPEARDGLGEAVLTSHVEHAKRFDSQIAAMHFWRQVSRTQPVRPDGQPNRPLTAYTVEIEPVES